MKKILIVEDNSNVVDFIKEYLARDKDLYIQDFASGTVALRNIKLNKPDLVILDLGLEDIRGENVCQEIKKLYPKLPIIILTGESAKEKMLNVFDLGADDYVTKPFDMDILAARIYAKLRNKSGQAANALLTIGDLTLNQDSYEVRRAGKLIDLTAREFALLRYLMLNPNLVLSRDKILNAVWGFINEVDTRVVDVHIGKLRKKIDEGSSKKLIQSIRGFGYKIAD